MDFWNTVLGHHLADVLIHYLPKLAEQKREQYIIKTDVANFEKVVREEIAKGNRYITNTTDGTHAIFIFEMDVTGR